MADADRLQCAAEPLAGDRGEPRVAEDRNLREELTRRLTCPPKIAWFWSCLWVASLPAWRWADSQFVLERGRATIVLEPYARSIIRVTLSKREKAALTAPGYRFLATPNVAGWDLSYVDGADLFKSDRLSVQIPGNSDNLKIPTAEGTVLVDLRSWMMNPAVIAGERTYHVAATFASPADEHYYGLGQNQEGFLDHRGHPVNCWHSYDAPGGESVCVPFLVTIRRYGLIWDNPSKTTIVPGFNEVTTWNSEAHLVLRHRRYNHG